MVKDKSNRLGRTHGIFEILNHPWLRKTQLQSVMSKQLTPPFIPNLLSFSFDENEIIKGESDFMKELESTLLSKNENIFEKEFHNFYFEDQTLRYNNQVKKSRKTESMFQQTHQSN